MNRPLTKHDVANVTTMIQDLLKLRAELLNIPYYVVPVETPEDEDAELFRSFNLATAALDILRGNLRRIV